MKVKSGPFILLNALIVFALTAGVWGSALAKEDTTSYFDLVFQEPAEVFLGKGGVYMVSSNYNGTAGITRIDPNHQYPTDDLIFIERWIEFHIYDQNTDAFPTLWGFNYVYFNLTHSSRMMIEEGKINIYQWDTSKSDWVECPTHLVEDENKPHGRASCVMTRFGLYGLAYER
jgi:hypothetical protein